MDINLLEMLKAYFIIPAFVFCLCLGYIIKEVKLFKNIANDYIPIIVAIAGIIISIAFQWGNVTVITIIAGMFSGLASTGFYEMFKRLIHRKNKEIN